VAKAIETSIDVVAEIAAQRRPQRLRQVLAGRSARIGAARR
jgi:hypothetical protein